MISLLLSRIEAGGLERVQLNLAEALARRGHAIEIVVGRVVSRPEAAVEVVEIAPLGAWQLLLRLPGWLLKRRPDVVATTSNDVAVWVLMWRRILRVRCAVVVTQHLAISGPRLAARGVRRFKLECIRWAMRRLLPDADAIVAVSVAVAHDMLAELGVGVDAISVIHNPIVDSQHDAARTIARPRPLAWPFCLDEVPVVLFVGRLAPEKRLDLLLSAFSKVRATRPARLLIVGEGSEAQTVSDWMRANDARSDCAMVGRVDDVLPWIQHGDVLALPSDYEGFGNVLVEAMQCATQVVATNCPSGPAEILDHGRYGQLVPVGDSDALAAALLASLDKRFHVPAQVLLARAGQFSIARAATAYEEIFNRVSGPGGRPTR